MKPPFPGRPSAAEPDDYNNRQTNAQKILLWCGATKAVQNIILQVRSINNVFLFYFCWGKERDKKWGQRPQNNMIRLPHYLPKL